MSTLTRACDTCVLILVPDACLRVAQGIKKVPTRMRIQISRRRNDDEDAQVCPYPSAGQAGASCSVAASKQILFIC